MTTPYYFRSLLLADLGIGGAEFAHTLGDARSTLCQWMSEPVVEPCRRLPDDFDIHETDLNEAVKDTSASYKKWLKAELKRVGKSALLT